MKHLAYIASLLLLCSCSDDLQPDEVGTAMPDGTPIEIAAAAEFPDMNFGADSRAFTDQPTEDDLRNKLKVNILMFDAAGVMLQYIPPEDITITDVDAANHTVHFKVKNIFSSTQPRRLHFVVTSADLLALEGGEYISAMANETTVMPALMSSGDTDVYWGLNEPSEITPTTSIQMKVIRNFVKLSVECTAEAAQSFTLEGYTVVNRPSKGTVAPYIYKNKTFASFLNPDGTPQDYNGIIGQDYIGVNPAGADENMTCTEVADVEAALTTNPCYFYERSQSKTATVNGAKVTYVIVKGRYNGATYYYKIDLGKNEHGDFKFFDLLRNFQYTITITKVEGPGATTLEDAMKGVAHNNISASTVTRDLFSINYKGDKIEVSSTRLIFTEKTTDHELSFRYTLPMPEGTETLDKFTSSALKIYDVSSEAQTHYDMNMAESWNANYLTGEVVKSTSISKVGGGDYDSGWYTLKITTNDLPADGRRRQQTLRIYYSDGETNLSRTVELILCQPWELGSVTTSTVSTTESGGACDIKFTLPSDLVSTQFPLVLTFESDKQNIYALKGTDLTVAVGKSGFKGATTDNVILYELNIPYATYNTTKEFTAQFLMNTTSAQDMDYSTAGIDAQANGDPKGNHRTGNTGTTNFCIRIANKGDLKHGGLKYIKPYYVNITR